MWHLAGGGYAWANLDLLDRHGGVRAGRVHNRERARVLHRPVVDRDGDGDRLVAGGPKGGVGREHLGRDVVVIIDDPLLAAIALDRLQHLSHDALGHAQLLARLLVFIVGDGALDNRVEAVVLDQLVALCGGRASGLSGSMAFSSQAMVSSAREAPRAMPHVEYSLKSSQITSRHVKPMPSQVQVSVRNGSTSSASCCLPAFIPDLTPNPHWHLP